jgi:hypothetical protein
MRRILATPGVTDILSESQIADLAVSHMGGNFGELPLEDRELNKKSFQGGGGYMSIFHIEEAEIWVITEADGSTTTVLLPSEY